MFRMLLAEAAGEELKRVRLRHGMAEARPSLLRIGLDTARAVWPAWPKRVIGPEVNRMAEFGVSVD